MSLGYALIQLPDLVFNVIDYLRKVRKPNAVKSGKEFKVQPTDRSDAINLKMVNRDDQLASLTLTEKRELQKMYKWWKSLKKK